MKRRTIAFTIMLCAVMLVRLALPVLAEMLKPTPSPYQVTTNFIEGYEEPISATLTLEHIPQTANPASPETPDIPEEPKTIEETFSFSTDFGMAQEARALLTFTATDRDMTESDWAQVKNWLYKLLPLALPMTEQMNPQEMAERLYEAVTGARAQAKPDENGEMPLWADAQIALKQIEVAAPYYPVLQRGSRDDDVKRLQERLIALGYLTGKADGQFGKITEKAVQELEGDLRAREQEAIDQMPTPEPTITPEPTETAAPTEMPDSTLDAEPTEAPEPTPTPMPKPEPATNVDGVVDLALSIKLYDDTLPLVSGDLQKGSNAAQIVRLQRRLVAMGVLLDAPDGDYGGNTRRAVRIFQHYNNLPETGVADEATQRALFSERAVPAKNAMLAQNAKGDDVKTLQKRLQLLGFTTAEPDGSFGRSTRVAVEKLQEYLRDMEVQAYKKQAAVSAPANPSDDGEDDEDAPVTFVPTVEVNGIADPLLLDAFYDASFPSVPQPQKNGASNLDVTRIQRRLISLEYMYYTMDGNFGDGTEEAVRAFQKRNGLSQDGVAGRETLKLLFSNSAKKALKPYMLKISIDKQRVYAYALDDQEQHTKLVRTMKCSTGLPDTPTPRGTYQASTGPGARWHYFKKFSCWAQYAYYIEGDYLFHSVLYNQKGGPVTSSSVRNLGSRASHGCVRLSVEDAKWIWENCPKNTKVVIY